MIHYCGKYKGVPVFQDAIMIGNHYYGTFFCKRTKNGRHYKVKDSICKTIDCIKKYIEQNIDHLYQ